MKDKFSEVERIFLSAIDLPKRERSQFVRRQCEGDAELERSILAVLDVDGDSHSILDNAPAAAAIALNAPDDGMSQSSQVTAAVHQLIKSKVLKRVNVDGSMRPSPLSDFESVFATYLSDVEACDALQASEFLGIVAEESMRIVVHQLGESSHVVPASNLSLSEEGRIRLGLIDEGLRDFETKWPDHAELFKMRYFVGLSLEDVASIVGTAMASEDRWKFAKAWMLDFLQATVVTDCKHRSDR